MKLFAPLLQKYSSQLSLVLILVGVQFIPHGTPAGIYALGLVHGCQFALAALAIVLVFRSSTIINFAQIQVGAFAGGLFFALVKYQSLLRGLHAMCANCVSSSPGGTWVQVNYWLSLALSLLVAVVISWLIYIAIIKRITNAPRLVSTVATIFVAELLAGMAGALPFLLSTKAQRSSAAVYRRAVTPPFDVKFRIPPTVFHSADVLTVIVTLMALAILTVFLRRSVTGVVTRAAAENPARALTLGVKVSSVTGRIWLLAGLLAGFSGVLSAMSGSNTPSTDPFAVDTLVYVLAVCIIARLSSLPLAAAAAMVFGILQMAVLWWSGSLVILSGLVLGLIVVVLLAQSAKVSRAEIAAQLSWRAAREVRPVPSELREHETVRFWTRSGAIFGAVLFLGGPWLLTEGQVNLATVVVITGILGASLLVLTGWAGQISLGQLSLAAIGAFVVGVWNAPFLIVVPVASIAGAVVAIIVGLPALKLRGLHLAVTTLAFAYAVSEILLSPTELGKHLRPIITRPSFAGISLENERTFYYFCLTMLILTLIGAVGVRRSRVGRALIATRDNEVAAQLFGIGYLRTQLGAFALSGFLAAFGGAMFAYSQHSVDVGSFSPTRSIALFLSVVVGGLGSVASPMIGVFVFGMLEVFHVGGNVQSLLTGLFGLLLVSLVPGGLGGVVFTTRDAWLRRIARRYNIIVPSLLADVGLLSWDHPIAAIRPKTRAGGGTIFIPHVYRIPDQWVVDGFPAKAVELSND